MLFSTRESMYRTHSNVEGCKGFYWNLVLLPWVMQQSQTHKNLPASQHCCISSLCGIINVDFHTFIFWQMCIIKLMWFVGSALIFVFQDSQVNIFKQEYLTIAGLRRKRRNQIRSETELFWCLVGVTSVICERRRPNTQSLFWSGGCSTWTWFVTTWTHSRKAHFLCKM